MKTFKRVMIVAAMLVAAMGYSAAQAPAPQAPADAPGIPGNGIAGSWFGTLKVNVMSLRLGLEVSEQDGKPSAVLDSIDQNAKVPVTSIDATAEGVKFECASIRGTFEGKFSPDGAELVGTWSQGGGTLPLTFKRQAKPFALKRPQEPVKPYPYREEMVSFTSKPADVVLAGTLTMPLGKGPFPAVVLMTGSGPQDRDEAIMGHKPFLLLADQLTRAGIAVLRYDDRGFGKSTGNYGASTHHDFAADGRAAFEFLKTRAEIDAKRVGLLGHSEGSVYAPYIAKDTKDVAFVVLLAGVGVPMKDLLTQQGVDIANASGVKYQMTDEDRAANEAIFARLATKDLGPETVGFVRTKMNEAMARYPDDLKKALALSDETIEMRVRMLVNPWFVELLSYDAGTELANIRCPVLALFGAKDTQVAAAANLAAMKQTFAAAGNRDVTFKTFDGLNHLFQHATTGSPSEYGTIEETMSPEVPATISAWIKKKT